MNILTWVEGSRLLTLLIVSEAMRKKAEFYTIHFDFNKYPQADVDCMEEDGSACSSEQHDWTNADWTTEVKKEIGIL